MPRWRAQRTTPSDSPPRITFNFRTTTLSGALSHLRILDLSRVLTGPWAIIPRLIHCSITGFSQDGPLSKLAGYDFIVQVMGGLMSITGERDDLPGGGPQKAGIAFADLMTGMYATVGILAASAHRTETVEGQYIDVALLDVQVAAMANMNLNYLVSVKTPRGQGNAHENIVPYQVFDANDGQFCKFCKFCEIAVCGLRFAVCGLRFAVCGLRFAVCGLRISGNRSAFCNESGTSD